MTLYTEDCNFRRISDMGQSLIDAEDSEALLGFTRELLCCSRLKECEFGDYCTILSASLLAEQDRHPHDLVPC